jgi:outer membrane protein
VFSPRLRWTRCEVPALAAATLRIAAGPNFASRGDHGYTYGVPQAAVTATRPAYTARGGCSGLSLSFTADCGFGPCRVFAYAVADSVRGAVFDDSPLVRRSSSVGGGVADVYVFASGSAGVAER